MNKPDLVFYDAYEEFYRMAAGSQAFRAFCKDAFGEDFSQDGFSDIAQIDRILEYIPAGEDVHILDIGCGNGKMLGYLQKKTGAYIHGFDYSGEAIKIAKELFADRAEFREGVIGEVDYGEESFDVITSMDTMYFAKDMTDFVAQVKRWLKKDGVFFVGYQEGDVMPKTESVETTVLVKALQQNGLKYEVFDITRQTYEMLQKKREAALVHEKEFLEEQQKDWLDLLLLQTECATETYEEFAGKMARYLFVVRKELRIGGEVGMEIYYKKLTEKEVDRFIELRIRQLREEGATEDMDLTPALKDYYDRHLADGTFVSWLAMDGEEIVGTSGMSFVEKPPYFGSPSGKIGLLSSMYTSDAYRRKGIAKELLSRVVQEAKEYGCGAVQITASDMGVLLYTDFGFVKNGNFMQYKF